VAVMFLCFLRFAHWESTCRRVVEQDDRDVDGLSSGTQRQLYCSFEGFEQMSRGIVAKISSAMEYELSKSSSIVLLVS
jgi:hypothetical protein